MKDEKMLQMSQRLGKKARAFHSGELLAVGAAVEWLMR